MADRQISGWTGTVRQMDRLWLWQMPQAHISLCCAACKYTRLASTDMWYLLSLYIETAGNWHELTIELTQEIGRYITTVETTFLFQCLCTAFQHFLSQFGLPIKSLSFFPSPHIRSCKPLIICYANLWLSSLGWLVSRLYVWTFQKKWKRSLSFCDKGNVVAFSS